MRRLRKQGAVVVAVILAGAVAKSSPGFSQTATQNRFTLQGPAEQSNSPVIRDALNRPCLDVEAVSRSHVANPAVMDHVVSMKNNCPRLIRVKICYFHSDRCKEVALQGYQRVDTILGTMMNVSSFRYQIIQK